MMLIVVGPDFRQRLIWRKIIHGSEPTKAAGEETSYLDEV
jgi:hypothetical protein